MVNSAVCFDIFAAYPISQWIPFVNGKVGIGGIVLGTIYFINAMMTLYWIRQQQLRAQRGMIGAAKHVIFPIYLPFLWLSAISDSVVGLVIFFYDINYQGPNSWNASIASGCIFAMQHFVIEGTAFILMQYGCGMIAAKNALIWAFGWAISTFIVMLIVYRDGDTNTGFYVNLAWNTVLLLFYFSLWYLPEKILFRRPSVIFYSRYWVLIRLIVFVSLILVHTGGYGSTSALMGNCLSIACGLILFMCLKPYVVYRALLMDSKWWQGVARHNRAGTNGGSIRSSGVSGHRYVRRSFSAALNRALITTGLRRNPSSNSQYSQLSQDEKSESSGSTSPSKRKKGNKYNQLSTPLEGVEVGFDDAQDLAREVDSISSSSVKLLNFAYISLDNKEKLLGAGSYSKVYAGKYKTIPVAIKMLFTQDLNPDVVKRCGNEARILSDISPHPNVVNIYGVAVLPPSVCLVLEICEYGSLSDVLRGMAVHAGNATFRPPLQLTYADKLFLAIGCAKGLQALHRYSPDLCHRDIKSMNFLIDSQLNAKICDLELGGIRDHNHRLSSDVTPTDLSARAQGHKINNYATNMNITWQAPEILLGEEYTQKSDIYSLSLVLWEIIGTCRTTKFNTKNNGRSNSTSGSSSSNSKSNNTVCNVPYSECKSQFEIREKVIRGFRPAIPLPYKEVSRRDSYQSNRDSESSQTSNGGPSNAYFISNGELDPIYINLIQTGWDGDPDVRPDIDEIVSALTRCWLNSVHRSIYETEYIVDIETIQEENLKLTLLRDFKASNSGNSAIISRSASGILLGHTHSRAPPSAAVISALSVMQSELSWSNLEEEGIAYLVVTSQSPHFILWATKKFTQLTGFLVNDVIAYDLDIFSGPLTNQPGLNESLTSVLHGNAEHLVTTIYRRDGRPVSVSLHMFPIYDSSRPEHEGDDVAAKLSFSTGTLDVGSHTKSAGSIQLDKESEAKVDPMVHATSPPQETVTHSSILDWGTSIRNMSPFRSSNASQSVHNPIQHSVPGGLMPTSTTKQKAQKRVAYVAIQLSTFNEKP